MQYRPIPTNNANESRIFNAGSTLSGEFLVEQSQSLKDSLAGDRIFDNM